MTETTPASLTKAQLFAELKKDGITIDVETITKAKNGDSEAMYNIGWNYNEKKQYDKVMAWYRLAAVKNNSDAQNSIGFLYENGFGVPQDYLVAMEWLLKAAIQNEKLAWGNIGELFEFGRGVPINKHKALEWYQKSGEYSDTVKALTDQGIQLTEQDKNKSIEQLIMETEDILWAARRAREDTSKEEIKSLKKLNTKVEKESRAQVEKIKSLEEEVQTVRDTSEIKQQELEQYKSKEQAANHEMQTLKQANSTQELKLEIKDNKINSLENEIKLLRVLLENLPQSTVKRMDEMEKSNQNLKDLLEQERRVKESEFELIKQKVESLSETVKQLRNDPVNENRTVKRKMIDVSTSSRKRPSTGSNSTDERNGCNNRREDATSEDTEYNNIKIESDDNDNDTK